MMNLVNRITSYWFDLQSNYSKNFKTLEKIIFYMDKKNCSYTEAKKTTQSLIEKNLDEQFHVIEDHISNQVEFFSQRYLIPSDPSFTSLETFQALTHSTQIKILQHILKTYY